jgi:predicted MPP superfamily phosphohydrolase
MISRRHFLGFGTGVGALGASTVAYGFTVEPLVRLQTTRYHLSPPQWPSDFPLTIAAIADLHACDPWMSLDRIAEIVDHTNALKPDVIVLLGDYVAGTHHVTRFIPASEWAPVLAGLKAPLGVHAVLGNHDWWEDKAVQHEGKGPPIARRALEAVGIPVYENDAQRLVKDNRPFWLAGLGDQLAYVPSWRAYPGRRMGVDDLSRTLAKVTDDAPVVLMAHEPDIVMRVPSRVALQLSGHTHGGQVRLFGWSPTVPSRYGSRFAYGHRREACDIVVSGGLGCSIVPFRLGVPPEIVVVTLGGSAAVPKVAGIERPLAATPSVI